MQHDNRSIDYTPFKGAVLTDTFQMYEAGDPIDLGMFVDNTERVLKQMETPVKVVIGNPPYSAGQTSANDNNANESYPTLDGKIACTYAAYTDATNKNSLYDSYIRSFRWASDRIGDRGVITFVSNAGWVRSEAASGMRKCLRDEFSSIYVFDLRGNQRTQGEQSRKEGGKIFGSGSRAPIAITTLVKNPDSDERGVIHYHDIGDYLTREDKLSIVGACIDEIIFDWDIIEPDKHNDWLDQRDESFYEFAPMGIENKPNKLPNGIFGCYTRGWETTRDAWAYNFSSVAVDANIRSMVEAYNAEYARTNGDPSKATNDKTQIAWSRGLRNRFKRGPIGYTEGAIRPALYRPFCRQYAYTDAALIEYPGQHLSYFPAGQTNLAIVVSSGKSLSCMISNTISDKHYLSDSQCFPLYWYEVSEASGGMFTSKGKMKRNNAITDEALSVFCAAYPNEYATRPKSKGGQGINKEDIFYYIYGILHSPEYRNRFESNLKKELPRIPLAHSFEAFASAGRALAHLHLSYETVEMYPLEIVGDEKKAGPVVKMKWGKKTDPETKKKVDDHSVLIYNRNLTFRDIPASVDRYVVNGRTPLEWMVDRYQVKTDKASGIVNDPNEYSDDPLYIINLVKRLVTVSVRTVEIVDELPPINELPQTANWPFAWGRVKNDGVDAQEVAQQELVIDTEPKEPAQKQRRARRKDPNEGMDALFASEELDNGAINS